jgi:hypothetical protein
LTKRSNKFTDYWINVTRDSAHSELGGASVFHCLLLVLFACLSIQAGEKIQFEGSAKSELPKGQAREATGTPQDFIGASKNEADSEFQASKQRPQMPIAAQRKKLEELIDRKKNWMFAKEAKDDSGPTINELFGIRETSLDGSDDKPKKVIDSFFEEKKKTVGGKREGANDNKSEGFGRKSDKREDDSEDSAKDQPTGIAELNLNRLIHPNDNVGLSQVGNEIAKPHFEPLGGNGTANQTKQNDRLKAEEARSENFQKLLQPRSPRTAGGALDPINTQSDQTRRELNPVTGQRSPDVTANFGSAEQRVDPIRGFSSSVSPSSAIESIANRPGSSLSPAVMAPFMQAPPPRFDPKPMPVLDFQRRRF